MHPLALGTNLTSEVFFSVMLGHIGPFQHPLSTKMMRPTRKRSASTSTRAGAAAASVLLASGVALLVLDESSLFSGILSSASPSRRSLLGSAAVTGSNDSDHAHAKPSATGLAANAPIAHALSTDERLLQMTADDASTYGAAAAADAAGDRRGLRTLLEEELHSVMTEENAGSEIWLINQPKCGKLCLFR